MVCADEVIRRGFRGRIRGIRRVGRLFREQAGLAQRAVDLVGGDVKESKGLSRLAAGSGQVIPCCFEQPEGPEDIGLDERGGAVDRTVHMAFRREIENAVRPVFVQEAFDEVGVRDVAPDEKMPPARRERGKIIQRGDVSRVGEFVERDDPAAVPDQESHQIAADKARASGDEIRFAFVHERHSFSVVSHRERTNVPAPVMPWSTVNAVHPQVRTRNGGLFPSM